MVSNDITVSGNDIISILLLQTTSTCVCVRERDSGGGGGGGREGGSGGTQVAVPRRGVTITPIQSSQPKPIIIGKALLKAVSKKQTGKKAQSATKTFVLRGINASTVRTTCSHLKALIRKQVGEEIIKGDFDVGYYLQGSNVITMRNKEDIQDLWCNLQRGSNTVIWCDALLVQQSGKTTHKRPSLDSDSDDEAQPSTKKTKK